MEALAGIGLLLMAFLIFKLVSREPLTGTNWDTLQECPECEGMASIEGERCPKCLGYGWLVADHYTGRLEYLVTDKELEAHGFKRESYQREFGDPHA